MIPPNHLTEIIQNITAIDKLHTYDTILNNYLKSTKQNKHILDIVRQIKTTNPQTKYFYDPIINHPKKNYIVTPNITKFHIRHNLPTNDIITPNLIKLKILYKHTINNIEKTILTTHKLITQKPQIILIKHLTRTNYNHNHFKILLITTDKT